MATLYFKHSHKIFSIQSDAGKTKPFHAHVFNAECKLIMQHVFERKINSHVSYLEKEIYDLTVYAENILIKSSDFTRICPNLEGEIRINS
jgi:hypothetical protein